MLNCSVPGLYNFQSQTKANTPQNQTATNSVVDPEPKKIDKKKLSVGAAAAVGITALVVGGLVYKRKIDGAAVKQLAEKIDFKNADTIEEAVEFGKKNLGIKKYKGFEKADLDVVNWINQGLVNLNNATKGKAVMPKKIKYIDSLGNHVATMNGVGTMEISKGHISNVKKFVSVSINSIKATSAEKEKFIKNIEKANNFASYQNTFMKCASLFPEQSKRIFTGTYTSTFSVINHELGHLQHSSNKSIKDLYYQLGRPEELKGIKITETGQKLRDLFESKKDVAASVSEYATTSPLEFVAEVYAQLVDGKIIGKDLVSDEVLDLYKKLGGVMV